MNQSSAFKELIMTILEKLADIKAAAVKFIVDSDTRYQASLAAIEGLKAKVLELETEREAAIAIVDEIAGAIPTNPTPNADAIVEAANESPVTNTPAVDAAIENTVGTDQPTSEQAVIEAVEMLAGEVSADEPAAE